MCLFVNRLFAFVWWVKSVAKKGGTALTPIKIEAMLVVLCQCFVMVVIQTGIGKTAGYAVYIKVLVWYLYRVLPEPLGLMYTLVITTIREIAAQVVFSIQNYSWHIHIRSDVVFGRGGIELQISLRQWSLHVFVVRSARLVHLYI